MTDICIFPIPGCVTFPGTVFPLHVFEPRYREMIHHCLDTQGLLAICNTRKQLSPGKQTDSLQEALSSNQATYIPQNVFSAGHCELVNTTDDGRLFVNVHLQQRFILGEEKQRLPFPIYACEAFDDEFRPQQLDSLQILKDKLMHRLTALVQADAEVRDAMLPVLMSPEWQNMDSEEFSFRLYSLIGFDADLLQQLLEMNSPAERMQFTLDLLNAA
ncbi:LON peptidase substrate-binding domain-containing protein [Thalassolituus marinus]|uniref:LON peptidase substrate-binding domain-containing protein n=1 Tax=Thalassolituus marinus TaxID=671053 RepID=A0ABS7ZRS1_9GAMM|nr:LON peptidase substrate-binding domain-containing protein [Thalassolituus marinus]MCA6064315.1 LON peptidase substrate-binding domain-containing protein [Thalassolituus marinus]